MGDIFDHQSIRYQSTANMHGMTSQILSRASARSLSPICVRGISSSPAIISTPQCALPRLASTASAEEARNRYPSIPCNQWVRVLEIAHKETRKMRLLYVLVCPIIDQNPITLL